MLLALLVDRDALEDQIVVVVRRDRRRLEDRILDAVFRHAILDDLDLEMQPAGHLDGAAEGDLAVALAEVQVAHRETAALHIDREVDLRAARQILDVAIAAVLARRHGARAFRRDLGLGIALGAAGMRGRRERRLGERRHAVRIGRDEARSRACSRCRAASGSGRQPIRPGWIRPAKFTPGHMARVGVEAVDVPDRFLRQREMIGEEAAAVLLGEEAVEAPQAFRQRRRRRADRPPADRRARRPRRRSGRTGNARSSDRCRARRRRSCCS